MKHSIRKDGILYTVDIDLGNYGLENIEVNVTGTRSIIGNNGTPPQVVNFKLRSNYREKLLNLFFVQNDEEILIARFLLDNFQNVDTDELPTKGKPDKIFQNAEFVLEYFEELKRLIDGDLKTDTLENLIQSIPAGDPMFGCLLKSSVSTLVGKTVKCYKEIKEEFTENIPFIEYGGLMVRCIGQNPFGMGLKIGYKTAICFASFGLR